MNNTKFSKHLFTGFGLLLIGALMLAGCGATSGQSSAIGTGASLALNVQNDQTTNPYWSTTDTAKLNVSKAEWKKILSPRLYRIAFEGGTDAPFTGQYTDYKGTGTFVCACLRASSLRCYHGVPQRNLLAQLLPAAHPHKRSPSGRRQPRHGTHPEPLFRA